MDAKEACNIERHTRYIEAIEIWREKDKTSWGGLPVPAAWLGGLPPPWRTVFARLARGAACLCPLHGVAACPDRGAQFLPDCGCDLQRAERRCSPHSTVHTCVRTYVDPQKHGDVRACI